MEANIKADLLFGRINLQSRMRPEGNRLIGEGRSLHYDGQGKLVKDTGWEPTGAILECPVPKPSWLQRILAKVRSECHGARA